MNLFTLGRSESWSHWYLAMFWLVVGKSSTSRNEAKNLGVPLVNNAALAVAGAPPEADKEIHTTGRSRQGSKVFSRTKYTFILLYRHLADGRPLFHR
jgi:hypothetical protein